MPAEAEAIYRRLSEYSLLGDVLMEQVNWAKAEAAYRKFIESAPTSWEDWAKLRGAWVKQGKPAEELLAEEVGVRRKYALGGNAPVRNELGVWCFGQGMLAEAEAEFRKAIELAEAPSQGEHFKHLLHANLGNTLEKQGRHKEAEDEYRVATHLEPDSDYAHNQLGNALYHWTRYEEAEAEYRVAIRLKPDDPVLHDNRGGALAELGRWEEASAEFIKATQCKTQNADAEHWYHRALLCLRDGNLDGYRKVCSDMLERFGKADYADASGEPAWTCVLAPNAGADPAKLVSLAEKVLAKGPKGHWQFNLLGAALYRAGCFDEAVKRLTEATALNADPFRSNMLYTWFFLAMAHQRLGHADEARRWLDKATQATEDALKPPAEPPGKSVNATGVIPPNWNRKLTLQLLRREAQGQIQGPGTKPAK
jgi:tetratricopeptide (TPR) repeat protein